MKRIACFLLALAVILSLAIPAFAADNDGKITIQGAANVPVTGKTFNVYKILDLTLDDSDPNNKHYSYTVPEALETFYKGYVWPAEMGKAEDGSDTLIREAGKYDDKSTDGDVTFDQFVYARLAAMSANSHELNQFAIAALAAAKKAEGILVKSGEANDTTLTFDGLPLGYYLIEDATAATKEVPVSALILDSTGREMVVTLKADVPTLDKTIDINKDKTSEGDAKANTAAIGDTVSFVVESNVPDMTGYSLYKEFYFIITDTLSKGLTYTENTMTVKVGDTVLTQGAPADATDTNYYYTLTTATDENTGVTTLTITFIDFYEKYNAMSSDTPIVVSYDAVLNANAVIGVEGNVNDATLTYSNNPSVDITGSPDTPDYPDNPEAPQPPVGKTPRSITETYVTELIIQKIDDAGHALTGAEFSVEGETMNTVLVKTDSFVEDANGTYYLLKDGTYTETEPTEETAEYYADTTKKYKSDANVTAQTKDLENYMKNVVVGRDGKLTLTGLQAGKYTITETKAPDGYNLLKTPIEITISCTVPKEITNDADAKCAWSYVLTNNSDGNAVLDQNATNLFQVKNQAGMELPSTGGMGTTLFYALGGTMMLMAVVLLVTRKRISM